MKELQGAKVVGVAAGALHCLALTSRGEVYSWGLGESGALGLGRGGPGSYGRLGPGPGEATQRL